MNKIKGYQLGLQGLFLLASLSVLAGCASQRNVTRPSALTFETPLRPLLRVKAAHNIAGHIRLGAYYYEHGDPGAAAAEFLAAAQKTRSDGDGLAMKHDCLMAAASSQLLADDIKGLDMTLKNIENNKLTSSYGRTPQDSRLQALIEATTLIKANGRR